MDQTKNHVSANDLAGLPGMPKTVKGINDQRLRGELDARPVKKKDGTDSKFFEYTIATLPDETRTALGIKTTKVGYEDPPVMKAVVKHAARIRQSADRAEQLRQEARAQSMADFQRLSAEKQLGANAKLAIIKASQRYITDHRLQKTLGQQTFCHEYNLQRIDVAPWVLEQIPRIHPATVRGWIKDEHDLGIMGLVDCYGNRKDQSKIETWSRTFLEDGTARAPMADTIVTLILKNPWIEAKACNEAMRALLPGAIAVSDKSVRRYMDKWKAQNRHQFMLATNPDDYKNRYQPAFGSRSEGITGPNQRWEIDATPADLLLTDGRHKIISVCDVGPRRLKLYVTKTERTRDNAFALRRCLLDWGVPYQGLLVTDQGSPYVNPRFDGLMNDLEIDQHICNPFSGDEKPHVERAFRTFSHDLVELLPGYCGHNVADRKAIEAQKSFAQRLRDPDSVIEMSMTSEQLQAFCDRWCAAYHNLEHEGLGKRTPNQVMAAWPNPIRTIKDERALDILLYEPVRPGNRLPIIGKKGIRVKPGMYIHELLGDHIGAHCRAFQDPINLGRIIVNVLNRHGVWEFLCIAVDPDLERDGITREEIARATRERHKETKKEMARLSREAKKELKGVDVVEAVLQLREREAAEAQGNVVNLPNRTVPHESAGLTEASRAAAAMDASSQEWQPGDELPQSYHDGLAEAGRRWVELNETREKENKIIPLPTAARPMFGSDLEKYKWLKSVDPSLWLYDDSTWIFYYEQTTEYHLMFGETETGEAY